MTTVVFHSTDYHGASEARGVLDFEVLIAWRMGLVQERIMVRRLASTPRYLVATAYLAFVMEIEP